MPIVIDVNTDGAKAFTKKLKMMHKSAFPSAVRSSLNSAAFDVKQKTMPKAAARKFEKRSPNFFKANSRVEMATGFNVSIMESKVGFVSSSLKNASTNYAVKELEQQEHGGMIRKKSFIPLATARAAGNKGRMVKSMNRLGSINGITNAMAAKGKNSKVQFIKSLIHAGKGGTVLSNFKGKRILWRINSIKRGNDWKWNFKMTPIYSFRKGRSVRVGATHFMEGASIISGGRIEQFYIDAALKIFNQIPR